jgi:pantoate--beta-alanine ligase
MSKSLLDQAEPEVVTRLAELRATIATWRRSGETIALTPTMGALHDGHLDLVRLARTVTTRRPATRVVTSIFVNPRQFAPHEDFDRYPRTLEKDVATLATVGVDLVWSPVPDEMYRPGFASRVEVDGAARGLETDFRPHFFGGVATVCTKLFSQVTPDFAVFGEKDFQQLAVIRQIVRDLDLPLEIVGCPTRREADGLALSSRNAYLDPRERAIAPALHRTLSTAADEVRQGAAHRDVEARAAAALAAAGFAKIDYFAVRDAVTLQAPATPSDATRLHILVAAWLGRTRLIDNLAV